jgi:hypothetical protein
MTASIRCSVPVTGSIKQLITVTSDSVHKPILPDTKEPYKSRKRHESVRCSRSEMDLHEAIRSVGSGRDNTFYPGLDGFQNY